MTTEKSRNSKTFVQSKTEVEDQSITDESFNNISEIQIEAKIQVPTRFRSREAMMKFKGKSSKKTSNVFDVQHKNLPEQHSKWIQIQDMKVEEGEFKTNETPDWGRPSESNQLDAESVLKMLRVPSRAQDSSPSKSSIWTPRDALSWRHKTQKELPIESLNFSMISPRIKLGQSLQSTDDIEGKFRIVS